MATWSPRQESNPRQRGTSSLHCRCATRAWSRRRESNPLPPVYETGARPVELHRHGAIGRIRTDTPLRARSSEPRESTKVPPRWPGAVGRIRTATVFPPPASQAGLSTLVPARPRCSGAAGSRTRVLKRSTGASTCVAGLGPATCYPCNGAGEREESPAPLSESLVSVVGPGRQMPPRGFLVPRIRG